MPVPLWTLSFVDSPVLVFRLRVLLCFCVFNLNAESGTGTSTVVNECAIRASPLSAIELDSF